MLDWQKHRKLKLFIKTICIVLIASLLAYDFAWAGAGEVLSRKSYQYSQKESRPVSIEIPQELGTIKESYASKYNSRKLVIHIQDAHANVEAQENEAKIIKYLKDKYNVDLVSVEGGFGDFDAEFFRKFPKDKKARDKVARYFLSKSFISGSDYLLITEDNPPAVYGAEDRELYTAHLNTFKNNQINADSLNKSLNTLEGVIETLKDRYYSRDLKELDARVNDFRLGRISLEEYLSYLNIASIINNVDLSGFPNLYSLIISQELEHKINFEQAETERQDLIDVLTKALSKADLEALVKNSLDFKTNKITPAEYYSYLGKLSKEAGIRVNVYSNLFTYIKYITLTEKLDNTKVFEEIDAFSDAVKDKLTTTSAQRDIDRFSSIIRILKGLSNINLSPKDYEYFKGNREVFNSKLIAGLLRKYTNFSVLNSFPADAEIASLEKFYALAYERDNAIVRNSLKRLNRDCGSNSVIIVAGGFHTQGLISILKEEDISYVVIAPSIKSSQDKENTYFALLKDKRLPLEDILNDPDTLQIISSISDPEARKLLVNYWVVRASRYYSVKELQAQLDRLHLSSDDQRAAVAALKEISSQAQLSQKEEAATQEQIMPKAKEETIPISHEEVRQGGVGAGKEEPPSAPLSAKDKKAAVPLIENSLRHESTVNPVSTIPKGPTLIERFTGFFAFLNPKSKEVVMLESKVLKKLTPAQRLAGLFASKYSDKQIQPKALGILKIAFRQEGLSDVTQDVRIKALNVARRLYLRPDTKSKELVEMFGLVKDELIQIYRLLKASNILQNVISTEVDRNTPASGFIEYVMKKLLRYGDRLERIFDNQVVYPVVVEWHPGETCDSNCIFCYNRGLNYSDRSQGRTPLSIQRSKELLREFAENDVREFWVSGGKEPLTNPITADVIKYAVDLGLDTRLYTNGIRMNRYVQERILGCSQVRISLNAATPETYKQVQGINGENFNRVVQNIGDLVRLKKERGSPVNIGMSFVLNPFNYKEIIKIANLAYSLRVNFLAIRTEQVGTIRKFTEEEIEEVLSSVETLRTNRDLGLYGGMVLDIRSLTREDLTSEKHYYPNMEKAKACQVRTLKMGMSPYGVVYMCEYAEHPRNAKPELKIGDASSLSFRELLQRSNEITHDPAKCEACMINEYGMNIGLEKLRMDKEFGIPLEEQPYRVIRENESLRQPLIANLTNRSMQYSQKGFVSLELLLGLGGLGLIGLSIPLFISGSMIVGGLTALLGISAFAAVILKPSVQQIKDFVRAKLTITMISLGLLLSVIFGNPTPSSPNLNPAIPYGNMPIVQAVSKEHARQITPISLPLYAQTEIRKQDGAYSLYINREQSPALFGMVYQPVPEGKHINEYRGNMAKIYKSLLDKSDGGEGDARILRDLGIKAIRIYDVSVDDAGEIKQIFRKIYQDYGIRVYVGNFVGLYENRDYQNQRDRQRIIGDVLKIINAYRDEPWLLGWQLGNEGNYYVINGKLGQRINLSLPEYYSFMDEIAGAIKQKLNDDLRQQIITLGNGDLTEEEADLISRMQNIDAVGINCFRDKAGVADLLKLAKERISKPIIISEIGLPARTTTEQQAQSRYLNDVVTLLDENSISRGGLGNVVLAFICEATDEQWKVTDSTKPEEAYLGVLGKDSEWTLQLLLGEIDRRNKSVALPGGIESEALIKSAWNALEVKDYELAIKYATDCIKSWSEEAKKQQRECLQRGEFPNTDLIKLKSIEFSGKNYDVYTRKVFDYWALNDVGAAYFIIGKATFEQGKQKEANAAFNEILNNYSYAQVQAVKGKMPAVRIIMLAKEGRPSKVFDLVEQGKVFEDAGYFKAKDVILGKENKSSPRSLSPEDLIFAAWQFLVNQDYDSTVAYADKCIELYQRKAQEQQNEALSLRKPPKTEREIWKYWALNDVGTSYFIKLRAAYEQGDKQQAREIYDELAKNYSQAQVRDLEGKYWPLKNAVRRLYPDLLTGLISIDKTKATLYALGVLTLITIRSIIGSLRSFGAALLSFLGLKQKAKGSNAPHVENIPVMSKKDRITFLALVFGELYLLFNFVSWWFHPIRMEYYIVSFPLFGFLSYLGACGIIFYLYVWHLVWSMQKPKYMAPSVGLKVAMATTFIESEPIELVKQTLLKMKQVRYPHETFVLDESNSPQLAAFCQQNGIIHFTRNGIAKYHQPQPPFQAKTKGGNLNAWLDTYGKNYEFVTFLDPDHQPEPIFLDRILGYFNDTKVGFVQAPHVYKNADESWIARGGAEQNYYFVGPIQMGLYGNNAAVVNGSHSTFRIEALESIGGYGVHNADDMLTSLRLHAKRWEGVFVPEVLAEGLTPATWGAYLQQQYRWSNSMFDMLLFRYPGQLLHLKLRQTLGYLILGSWYFLQVNLLLLMILPIISVVINQPPVNLELANFLKYFMPFYLSQMLILIGWSQKFLLKPQIEKGVWWRGGMLWVASSIYITYSFIRALFKIGLLRTKFVTPKTTETGVSYLRLFVPHIVLVAISIFALGYSFFLDSHLWQTRGMKLFLIIGITSLTGLIITSTKWFSNWYTNCTGKTENPPENPNKGIQTQVLTKPSGDNPSSKANNKGFTTPQLILILTGLGLVGLSISIIIAGSMALGITVTILGSSAVIIPCLVSSADLFIGSPKTKSHSISGVISQREPKPLIAESKPSDQEPIKVEPKPEHSENSILTDISHIEESPAKTSEIKSGEELPLIFGDPVAKALFSLDNDKNVILNQRAIIAINSLNYAYNGLTLEIDIDTLIDTSKGMPQLKSYGFKEAVIALYKAQQSKEVPRDVRVRLINLNPQLDKAKITKTLGINEGLLKEFIAIPEIPEDYLIKGLEPYLIDGSVRVVFEDNLKYWRSKVDVVVKKGNETRVLSSLGLIVAALAKEPKFYQELPQELKDYIAAVSDEKGDIVLDDQNKIKQLIFKPIEKEKLNTEYIGELNKANKALEGML